MGSLLKPFLILAYGSTHAHFPEVYCGGARDGCWFKKGHGKQNIVTGLANSCNAFFLSLAGAIDGAALDSVCLTYGLTRPERGAKAAGLIGLGDGWPQEPGSVAEAFARLVRNRKLQNVDTVLAGMARCAAAGTAREAKIACFAKTGTAPCSHLPRASGDGFVVAIYPMDQPRTVLLLAHHNATGAMTAREVREFLVKLD
jgi:cell division protein FtsI/penicillin-binding protein 2